MATAAFAVIEGGEVQPGEQSDPKWLPRRIQDEQKRFLPG
jgi:hypothetical protein